MHDAHEFLTTLAVVLCVAAVTTVVFQRLRQPVVFGYLFAGMIVGPHVPIPIVADVETVQTLSETGVILLLFSLGLEFSLRKLIRVGPRAGIVAVVTAAVMIWLGYSLGRAFGWTKIAIFLLAVLTTISSGTAVSAGSLALTGMRLAIFLIGLVGVGLLLPLRAVR